MIFCFWFQFKKSTEAMQTTQFQMDIYPLPYVQTKRHQAWNGILSSSLGVKQIYEWKIARSCQLWASHWKIKPLNHRKNEKKLLKMSQISISNRKNRAVMRWSLHLLILIAFELYPTFRVALFWFGVRAGEKFSQDFFFNRPLHSVYIL